MQTRKNKDKKVTVLDNIEQIRHSDANIEWSSDEDLALKLL